MVLNIRHMVQPVQEPMDTSDDAGVFNVELQNSLSLIHKFLQAISFLFFSLSADLENRLTNPPAPQPTKGGVQDSLELLSIEAEERSGMTIANTASFKGLVQQFMDVTNSSEGSGLRTRIALI